MTQDYRCDAETSEMSCLWRASGGHYLWYRRYDGDRVSIGVSQEGMMGGDNIPRRPPIWECVCGCRRFRKVNRDGTDAPVKLKMLKNVRKAPATRINWESNMAIDAVGKNEYVKTHHYKVEVRTELGEKEIVSVTAVDEQDAEDMALALVMKGAVGLKGRICTYNVVVEEE